MATTSGKFPCWKQDLMYFHRLIVSQYLIITVSQFLIIKSLLVTSEAVSQRCSVKKVFLEIHRKTPVPESLF